MRARTGARTRTHTGKRLRTWTTKLDLFRLGTWQSLEGSKHSWQSRRIENSSIHVKNNKTSQLSICSCWYVVWFNFLLHLLQFCFFLSFFPNKQKGYELAVCWCVCVDAACVCACVCAFSCWCCIYLHVTLSLCFMLPAFPQHFQTLDRTSISNCPRAALVILFFS